MSNNSIHLTPEDNKRLLILCGECDCNLHYIEKYFHTKIINRGFIFQIADKKTATKILNLLKDLYEITKHKSSISTKDIYLTIKNNNPKLINNNSKLDKIQPKTNNQFNYIKTINNNTITFAIGPAGTGKTYLAVATALQSLKDQQVKKIILSRPAVEAGEKLGFLPGDLYEKINPYLQPLYDALQDISSKEEINTMLSNKTIEVIPLAYMRGRTLNNAFIILDEAQNTTPIQLKMFLTRIGFNSKAIINGDLTQTDLPNNQQSGLEHSLQVLQNIKDIGHVLLTTEDVIRHPIVAKIIEAYDNYQNQQKS